MLQSGGETRQVPELAEFGGRSGWSVHHVRQRSRMRFSRIVRENAIPPALILNYDQTWINAYRCPKSTLRSKREKRSKNLTRILNIVGGRRGISLCTSSWMNGDRGPLFVSVGATGLSQKYIDSMNQTLSCCDSSCILWQELL